MAEVIYFESNDPVAAVRERVRERIAASGGDRFLIVVGDEAPFLRDLVKLKVLRREAQNLGVDVALVTRDSATQVLAREAGLSVFSSVEAGGKKAGWRLATTEETVISRPTSRPSMEERPAPQVQRESGFRWGRFLLATMLFVVGVGTLALGVVYLALPSASVTLVPATQTVEGTFEVVADTELDAVDAEAGKVPARIVDVVLTGQAEAPALTRKDVPEGRATGTVTFINKQDETVTIPEGTIVSTSGGSNISFRTVEEISLEGRSGASARVGIVALEPGGQGNVDAFTINQVEPSYSFMTNVINEQATSGGEIRQVGVTTEEDRNRLRGTLVQRMEQEARTRLAQQAGVGSFVAADSIATSVVNATFEEAGEQSEMIRLTLRVRAQGIAVSEADAEALAAEWLSERTDPSFRLLPETVVAERQAVVDVGEGEVRYNLRASGQAKARIRANEVAAVLRGRTVEGAEQYLRDRWELAVPPVVQVTPEWFGRMPWLSFRTQVSVAEED